MPETVPAPVKPDKETETAPAPARPKPETRPTPFDPVWPEDRPLPQPKGKLACHSPDVGGFNDDQDGGELLNGLATVGGGGLGPWLIWIR